jgi:hypothetical protein
VSDIERRAYDLSQRMFDRMEEAGIEEEDLAIVGPFVRQVAVAAAAIEMHPLDFVHVNFSLGHCVLLYGPCGCPRCVEG